MAGDWTLLREADSRETFEKMADGEVGLVRKADGVEVLVKCSHRQDGACTACLIPALDGILNLRRALAASREEARRATESERKAIEWTRGMDRQIVTLGRERDAARAAATDHRVRLEEEWTLRIAAEARTERLARMLRAVEVHHVALNDAAGRPRTNSNTLRIVQAALAGCDHIPGDVCRTCQPSLPICASHPDAPLRRFGALWRCSECGEPGTLLQAAALANDGKRETRHG